MTDRELPDFATWSLDRLSGQRDHLVQILMTMAGQPDPLKPRLRAELAAIREEIGRRPDHKPRGGAMTECICDVRKGDRYDWNGITITVLRVARDLTWADIRAEAPGGNSWTKRQRLPMEITARIEDGPL
jgi:hypothetical protein